MEYITTPVGRLSYPTLFRPRASVEGAEAKFSVNLLFDGETDLAKLKALVKATLRDTYPDGDLPRNFRMGFDLQDDQAEAGSAGHVAGHYMLKASTKRKPTIVDRNMNPITDESLIYPGAWARLSVRPYCYSNKSKGLSFELNSVQFIADGEPLAGGPSAKAAFGDDVNDDVLAKVKASAPADDLPGRQDDGPRKAKRSALDDLL